MNIFQSLKSFLTKKKNDHLTSSGSIIIEFDDNYDSGLALLLVKPPKKELSIEYQDAKFTVSPDNPYCICAFSDGKSHEEAYVKGMLLSQECLDILSMKGMVDLATRDVTTEYFIWWKDDQKKIFTYIETFTFSFSVGNPKLILRDNDGNIMPPKPSLPPIYTPAFRYYRLSQISDDLFDAFRNMYLAFELLLSSHYPKKNVREIDWLRQSLQSAEIELNLQSLVPKGTLSVVDYIVGNIYINARLPLFHSKSGKNYFTPNNLNDRKSVSTALNSLTQIVIRMADKWNSSHRMSGWVNLKAMEEYYEKLLLNSSFIYCDNPKFTIEDTIESKSIRKGIRFNAQFKTSFLNESIPNIEGEVSLSLIKNRLPLAAIVVKNEKMVLLISTPERKIKLKGFDLLKTVFILRGNNASQPRSSYSR